MLAKSTTYRARLAPAAKDADRHFDAEVKSAGSVQKCGKKRDRGRQVEDQRSRFQFPGSLPGGLAAWFPCRCLAGPAVHGMHAVERSEGLDIAIPILIAVAILLIRLARRVVDDELHDDRHRTGSSSAWP